jgi:hypothetical protein
MQELIAKYTELVSSHDLTFRYSDDPTYYRRGNNEYAAIMALAKQIDLATAKAIWNANVDRSIVESGRKEFYWK